MKEIQIEAGKDVPEELKDMLKDMFGSLPNPPDGIKIMSQSEYDALGGEEGMNKIMKEQGQKALMTGMLDTEGGGPQAFSMLSAKNLGNVPHMLIQMIVEKVIKGSVPYNGVEGDTCICEECNVRRLLKGPNPGVDAEHGKEVDEETKEALAMKRAEDLLEKIEALPDDLELDSPEFEKLDEKTQLKIKNRKLGELNEALSKKLEEIVDSFFHAQGCIRILQLLTKKRIKGEKMSSFAPILEGILMEQIGSVMKVVARHDSKEN